MPRQCQEPSSKQRNLKFVDSLHKSLKVRDKDDKTILADYLALPEEIKLIAKEYWMNVAEGIDFRVLYDEAYRTGYEDCELKWREIDNVPHGRAD